MHSIDLFVQSYVYTIRTVPLTEFMYLVSRLFDVSAYSVLVVLCVAALVWMLRGKKYALLFFLTISCTALLVGVLKIIFNTARPTDIVMTTFGQSFPSYHAAVATVFFVLLMYIFDGYFSRVSRVIFNALCISAIFLVAFSRVYLGVHWTSDVFAGIVLGAVISYVAVWIFRKK